MNKYLIKTYTCIHRHTHTIVHTRTYVHTIFFSVLYAVVYRTRNCTLHHLPWSPKRLLRDSMGNSILLSTQHQYCEHQFACQAQCMADPLITFYGGSLRPWRRLMTNDNDDIYFSVWSRRHDGFDAGFPLLPLRDEARMEMSRQRDQFLSLHTVSKPLFTSSITCRLLKSC